MLSGTNFIEWKAKIESFASATESPLSSKRTNVVDISAKKASHSRGLSSSIDVNARIGQQSGALNEDELRDQVRRIVMYGVIRETKHSVKDRSYRNVSQDDILAMLQGTWILEKQPEWNEDRKVWKYKLSGADIEGDALILVIDVNVEMQRIEIITKF